MPTSKTHRGIVKAPHTPDRATVLPPSDSFLDKSTRGAYIARIRRLQELEGSIRIAENAEVLQDLRARYAEFSMTTPTPNHQRTGPLFHLGCREWASRPVRRTRSDPRFLPGRVKDFHLRYPLQPQFPNRRHESRRTMVLSYAWKSAFGEVAIAKPFNQ